MSPFRAWWRRFSLGLPTISGFGRRGFFIPYRYAGIIRPAGGQTRYGWIEGRMAAQEGGMAAWIDAADNFTDDLKAIGGGKPPEPRWDQDWFPRTDAAMAYTIARTVSPRRIVEIGCGHSTRFFARAMEHGNSSGRILGIDPAPRADLAGIERVELRRSTLQEADMTAFEAIAPGDILAIDSSHILMPGTDVDILLNNLLPALPAGCYVHIHDIFLPDPYPADWEWRGYNEQQGIGPLIASDGWNVEFSSHYALTRMSERMSRSVIAGLPLKEGARETSLWLRKL